MGGGGDGGGGGGMEGAMGDAGPAKAEDLSIDVAAAADEAAALGGAGTRTARHHKAERDAAIGAAVTGRSRVAATPEQLYGRKAPDMSGVNQTAVKATFHKCSSCRIKVPSADIQTREKVRAMACVRARARARGRAANQAATGRCKMRSPRARSRLNACVRACGRACMRPAYQADRPLSECRYC